MNPREGAIRWAFQVTKWEPTQEQWDLALSLLPKEEKERILRFRRPTKEGYITGRFNSDAKSSCIGRLLMRLLANKILDIPFNEIQFGRTKENKPYLINKTNKFPNFNFNISHSGDYVVLASEPMDLVGVDVMEMKIPNHKDKDEDILDFFSNMKDCFTSFEWSNIKFSNNLHKQVEQFFIHWTLKESYIKAVGIGLGFELQRAEFTLDNSHYATKATIKIDEKEQPQWKFNLEYIGNYVIAVARGPPSEAILSYQKVLNINNTNHNYQSSLFPHENENSPSFRILTFEELIISS